MEYKEKELKEQIWDKALADDAQRLRDVNDGMRTTVFAASCRILAILGGFT